MKINKLKLKKLNNTRDLGGLKTEDGFVINYGLLFRSGKLYKLPQITKDALISHGVTKIIDLRNDSECADYPCDLPDGCEYIRLPLICTATVGITYTKSMRRIMKEESQIIKKQYGNVDNYMIAFYKNLLFLPESQEKLSQFLRLIIQSEGGVLFNCSAGKDRTGICAMLLESLLGVKKEIIIKDYTLSYTFQRRKRRFQKIGLRIVPVSRMFRSILIAMMHAKPLYLKSAMEEVEKLYGTVRNYCMKVLNITEDDIAILKQKYLVKA